MKKCKKLKIKLTKFWIIFKYICYYFNFKKFVYNFSKHLNTKGPQFYLFLIFVLNFSSSPSLSLSSSSGSLNGTGNNNAKSGHQHSSLPPPPLLSLGAISRRSIVSRSEATAFSGRRASLGDESTLNSESLDFTASLPPEDLHDCWVDVEKLVAVSFNFFITLVLFWKN